MLPRPRRGEAEPRRARRRTASPVSASRVHGFLFRFLPETARRTSAWLGDGFMPPGSPKSLAASRGVQWSKTRRAAARPSAHCRPARTTPCASGRSDSVGLLRPPARTLPFSRNGPPLSSRRTCTIRHSAATRLPEIGERFGTLRDPSGPFGPFLDEGCERPPWRSRSPSRRRTQKFAPPRRLSGRASRGTNRDCDTGMGLWVRANILPRGREHSFLPRAKSGTAFCHEIADFGLEAPRPEPE